jgi:hypothetical protein
LALLVFGVAVLFVAALTPTLPAAPLDDRTAVVTRASAQEFYAAQDEALKSGDASRLIAAVAPSFVDHLAKTGTRPNRDGLVSEIMALRRTQPGLRLTTEMFVIDGDRALVYVSAHADIAASPLPGTPEPLTRSADTVEVVRVAGGVVVERWRLTDAGGLWPPQVIPPTATPEWSASRMATATIENQVCLASACH